MTVSKKQLAANRKNAKKGGVKTDEGKAVVKYNALKHGLLSKEIVVKTGEGAEDQGAFDQLLNDLVAQLKPVGSIEEMLVEKIAVAYWRLRRAYRFEVGILRDKLDHVTDNYFNALDWKDDKIERKSEKLEKEIAELQNKVAYWEKDKKDLQAMFKKKIDLSKIYDWDTNWQNLQNELEDFLFEYEIEIYIEAEELTQFLCGLENWDEQRIWRALISNCEDTAKFYREEVKILEQQLAIEQEKNMLAIQRKKKLASLPDKYSLERLLRYETAIQRQFYKALNELERLQRLRIGDIVPPPLDVNVSVDA